MSARGITLTRHIMTKRETTLPQRDLALIMERIEFVAKRISRELTIASLGGETGFTGQTNVQGEQVKKLDEWGNDVFLEAFEHGHPVCSLISEEMDEPRHYPGSCKGESYCVLYDPIDGSSNTDVNGSLGTIFAVKKRNAGHGNGIHDLLTAGTEQAVAGYIAMALLHKLFTQRAAELISFRSIRVSASSSCGVRTSRCRRMAAFTRPTRAISANGIPTPARISTESRAAKTNAPAIRSATAAPSPMISIAFCSRAASTFTPVK